MVQRLGKVDLLGEEELCRSVLPVTVAIVVVTEVAADVNWVLT